MTSTGDPNDATITVIEVNESSTADEISPLLVDVSNKAPKMTIFSLSNPRKKPLKELALGGGSEAEVMTASQIASWIWSGSRYSGLLCGASASTIYYVMEVLMVVFPVQSVPLFQIVFTRCTVILVLSFLWLRRTGQPLFGPPHIRNILVLRSLIGFISMLSFVYSVQNLPLSLAVTLNFATPVMASIGAKFILQEKLNLSNIVGLACSFLGLLFIFQPMLIIKGSAEGNHPIFAVFGGISSSVLGGISYCLIRAGAKSSDRPVYTVLAFGLLACPVSAICTFTLQEFVLPNIFTFILTILMGLLAFFAEISLARGLQLERISKITNILYIKVLLTQIWSMTFLGAAASFGKLIGCLLVLASVSSTLYLGPDKD